MVESADPREQDQEPIEATGRNVDEAIRRGLSELGITREQAEIEVLSEGRPGILGVGAQPARVRLTPRAQPSQATQTTPTAPPAAEPPAPAPARPRRAPRTAAPAAATSETAAEALDDDFINQGAGAPGKALTLDLDLITESAVDTLETLLSLMDVDADVAARPPETPGDGTGMVAAVLDVTGVDDEEQGLLIGRRGETLSALQYLLNLIVNHQTRSHSVFGIDVDGYRRRRETALGDLARRVADRVRQNGQAMTLEPMPPAERRIVHLTLSDDPDVETISIGEGEARKVAITPKQ